MMRSKLFKRASQVCDCGKSGCSCSSSHGEVLAAIDDVKKLASYLDEVDADFEKVRWASNALKKLTDFAKKGTDVVSASVFSTIGEINEFKKKLAAADFDYSRLVEEDSPSDMFGVNEGEIHENVSGVDKVAASELLDGVGAETGDQPTSDAGRERWENFSNEALTSMIQTLSETDEFATDKESQKSVSEMAEVLSDRPTTIAEETEEVKDKKAARILPRGLRTAGVHVDDPVADQVQDPTNPTPEDLSQERLNTPNDSINNALKGGKSASEDSAKEDFEAQEKKSDSLLKKVNSLLEDLATSEGVVPKVLLDVKGNLESAKTSLERLKSESESAALRAEQQEKPVEKKSKLMRGLRIPSTE